MSVRKLVVLIAVLVASKVATARPQYAEKMHGMYPAFAKKFGNSTRKITCSVCHVKTGAKSNYKQRNNYGFEVSAALPAKKPVSDKAMIEAAIKKAEAGNSATAGKTFGDLINDVKLPGTNVEKK